MTENKTTQQAEARMLRTFCEAIAAEALRLEAEGSQESADLLWDEAHAYWRASVDATRASLYADLQSQVCALMSEAEVKTEQAHEPVTEVVERAEVTNLAGESVGVFLVVK